MMFLRNEEENLIIEVKDINAPELAIFSKLTESQLRNRLEPEKGIFIAESPKVINTALDNGYVPTALLMEKRHLEGQGKAIIERSGDIPVYTGERSVLASLTGYELTRGVLCAMKRPLKRDLEEIISDKNRIAVLEGVVDSTNIGAIFRSAAALGMDAVLLTKNCCDPYNRRSVRVSMGTVFQIPWTYIDDVAALKNYGFKTCAMALTDESVSIDDEKLNSEKKLAVVLGAEGDGLSKTTITACDYTVKIPMYHGVVSLNVAVASAVAFWQLRSK